MSDKKITELPTATAITSDDLIAIVDDPNGSPITKRATAGLLASFVSSAAAQVYEGRAPNAPDDPTRAAINYPTGGGSIEQWSVAGQTWV